MPAFRYQMPQNLFDAAKKNLSREDSTVSQFNNVASGVRIPYSTTNGSTPPVTNGAPTPQSAFSLSLGGAIDTSIGDPVPSFQNDSRFRNSTISQTNGANGNTDWRFQGFQNNLDKPAVVQNGAYGTSPDAYKTNPAAYNQISSPVIPPNYQPKDMSAEQKKYGWGSAAE